MNAHMEINDLQFSYCNKNSGAIKIDSLSVQAGGLLALLGASGAGKTTILRLISGLLKPHSGSITLDQQEITNLDPAERRIGMVFQQPMLFPYLDVIGNVAFPLRLQGLSKTKAQLAAESFIEMVGMRQFSRASISTLSGGQGQRIALARALAAKPRLLLLDEPFSALDVDIRSEMQDLIATLRAETQLTMILVTHDQREAGVLADQVALIENGKIIQSGSMSDLYRRPASLQVFQAMGGVNQIDGIVKGDLFHSSFGTFTLRPDNQVTGPASLLFRQEAAKIIASDSKIPNSIIGAVSSIRTIGFRYEVGIDYDGQEMRIESSFAPRIGERVTVLIPQEEFQVIPRVVEVRPELSSNELETIRPEFVMHPSVAN